MGLILKYMCYNIQVLIYRVIFFKMKEIVSFIPVNITNKKTLLNRNKREF